MEILSVILIGIYMAGTLAYLAYLFWQKSVFHDFGFGALVLGFGLHTGLILLGLFESGHLPVHDLAATLSLAGWTLAGVFIGFKYRYNLKILGVYAAFLITLIMVAAYLVPATPDHASRHLFQSVWFYFHILFIFMGEAALALACGVGILYLFQEHAIKSKQRGFFYKRLPALEFLDHTGNGAVVIGFSMLTIGLISGATYAKMVWGHFWSWDVKEVFAGISWLIYAALIHQRLTVGWRGRRSAIMAIIGFALIVFTFLGVNLFLESHHGSFNR